MNYHWLRDRQTQKQIMVYWKKEEDNNANYTTKHHPIKYHAHMQRRKNYAHDTAPTDL